MEVLLADDITLEDVPVVPVEMSYSKIMTEEDLLSTLYKNQKKLTIEVLDYTGFF